MKKSRKKGLGPDKQSGPGKVKLSLRDNIESIVIIGLFSVVALYIIFSSFEREPAPAAAPHSTPSVAATAPGIDPSLVCMVNDAFMGRTQIPVPVEDKIYYGCCENCKNQLKNVREIRYAKDPLTGEEVDKAQAFIVLKPKGNGVVLYFKDEVNFSNFKNYHKRP